jgi:hypothetical protein
MHSNSAKIKKNKDTRDRGRLFFRCYLWREVVVMEKCCWIRNYCFFGQHMRVESTDFTTPGIPPMVEHEAFDISPPASTTPLGWIQHLAPVLVLGPGRLIDAPPEHLLLLLLFLFLCMLYLLLREKTPDTTIPIQEK